MYAHLTIVASSSITDAANALMAALSGIPDLQALSAPLVPVGSPPGTTPTHFAGSGPVGADMVPYLFSAQVLADTAQIPLEQAQALLSQADITYLPTSPGIPEGVAPESFYEVLTRLNLKRPDLIEEGL